MFLKPFMYSYTNDTYYYSMDRKTGAFSSYSLDSGTYVLNVSASDGRFTKYGVIEVKVVSITDEMMSQSVAIRIERLTAAEFVSTLRRSFETALTGLSTDIRYVYLQQVSRYVGFKKSVFASKFG